jgi:hypothetical protein
MFEFLANIENPPGWAKNWCDLYLLASAFTGLTAVLTLLILVFSFEVIKKRGLLFLYALALIFQATNTMVFYWICKRSLK